MREALIRDVMISLGWKDDYRLQNCTLPVDLVDGPFLMWFIPDKDGGKLLTFSECPKVYSPEDGEPLLVNVSELEHNAVVNLKSPTIGVLTKSTHFRDWAVRRELGSGVPILQGPVFFTGPEAELSVEIVEADLRRKLTEGVPVVSDYLTKFRKVMEGKL